MSELRDSFREMLKQTAPTAMVVGQAPGNVDMTYPAIRYEKDDEVARFADNNPFNITDGYSVTCIEKEPDTPIANLVRQLPMCSFNRFYVADNLNHTVYTIYFRQGVHA